LAIWDRWRGRLPNRDADNWRPLFTIAELAGGGWPERVRRAALAQTGASDDEAYNIQLLVDIRDVFAEKGLTEDVEGMPSADLVAALVAMPERSWGECNRGKALTQNGLARRLKPFGIRTRDVHTGYGRRETRSFKGYALESLKEAFARYIPGFATAPPRNSTKNNGVEGNQTAQQDNGCADENLANELKSRE
jgi:hypothetical protein